MNENHTFEQRLAIAKGRRRTKILGLSIILFSINADLITLLSYTEAEISAFLIFKHLFRFLATVFLVISTYKGKNWARIILIICFSLAILLAFFMFFVLLLSDITTLKKVLSVIISTFLIYGLSVYYFIFSLNFKAFFKEQQNNNQ
ncbi:hypothetical protein [Aquimarina algiphila]|uniref:hypothetical protein n=1 Tax=Aquimarina algiphila TaxID=2047982 RepID=UPI00232BF141|nr:hypothetical protein [Aquimarina algiphila]